MFRTMPSKARSSPERSIESRGNSRKKNVARRCDRHHKMEVVFGFPGLTSDMTIVRAIRCHLMCHSGGTSLNYLG